jgi:hypothetical protein
MISTLFIGPEKPSSCHSAIGLVAQALITSAVSAIANGLNRAGIFINNLPR